jgi:hypothetical protein
VIRRIGAGRVGRRGDNCDFLVRGFREDRRRIVLL